MIQHFIVTDTFTHQIDCFCPCEKHLEFITLQIGDIIEVTSDRKFTIGKGWYILIMINDQRPFYIAIDDLSQYYKKNLILTLLDIELKINYLHVQINQSLDTYNKGTFLNYTTELNELTILKKKYNTFLGKEESTTLI